MVFNVNRSIKIFRFVLYYLEQLQLKGEQGDLQRFKGQFLKLYLRHHPYSLLFTLALCHSPSRTHSQVNLELVIVEVDLTLPLTGLGCRNKRVQQLIGLVMSALYLCAFDPGQHNQSVELADLAIIPHFCIRTSLNLLQSFNVLLQLALVRADVCINTIHS